MIHVREGDRINFTLRNRSTDEVSVTEPDKSDAPFLQQLAAVNQQKAVPLAPRCTTRSIFTPLPSRPTTSGG